MYFPPRVTFAVADVQYFVTFAVMFLVALVISHLTTLIRQQARAARSHERQTAAMQLIGRAPPPATIGVMVRRAAPYKLCHIFPG